MAEVRSSKRGDEFLHLQNVLSADAEQCLKKDCSWGLLPMPQLPHMVLTPSAVWTLAILGRGGDGRGVP